MGTGIANLLAFVLVFFEQTAPDGNRFFYSDADLS